MKVIIDCERSGIVREAFKRRGHDAWSCDLEPTEIPGNHYQCDMRDIDYSQFDLVIAHPDCTDLAGSGARWWSEKEWEQGIALGIFQWLLDLPVARIAVENPVGIVSSVIRPPDQYIQPWQFGHGETKKTGLWLKNLPLLQPTNIVDGRYGRVWREGPSPERKMNRSRTYQGIADAMAEQWGDIERGQA